MKKRVVGKKLSRGGGARKALYFSLVRALIISGKIQTTKAKAKAIIPEVDKLVTLALGNDVRRVAAFFRNDRKLSAEFFKLTRSFSGRKSGFTRLINLPARKGDLANMVRLEWTDNIVKSEKDDREKSKKKTEEVKPKKIPKAEMKAKKTKKT